MASIAREVGRAVLRGHRPHRRAHRGRRAPVAGAARRRRHDDDAQDAARAARRHDPLPDRARPGDRPRRVPRPAGRPARPQHGGAGGGAARGGAAVLQGLREAGRRQRTRPRRGADGPGLRRRLGRHRQPPHPDRPDEQERLRARSRPRRSTRRGSSSTTTRSPTTRASRSTRRGSAWARRRSPAAAWARPR